MKNLNYLLPVLLFIFCQQTVSAQSRAATFSLSGATIADWTDFGTMLTDGEAGIADVSNVAYQMFFANGAGNALGTVQFVGYNDPSLIDGRRGYIIPGNSAAHQFVMQTADGSEFSFKSIYLVNEGGASAADLTVEVIGYRNGIPTGTITANADNAQFGYFLTQSNGLIPSIFQNVDKVVIRPTSGSYYNTELYYYFNDIGFDNAITGTLPVHFSSFDAAVIKNEVGLKWATGHELDNSHFVILRSADGTQFEEIGKVQGNGTSNTTFQYSFVDKNPLPGKNYYRLKQYDINGGFSLSSIKLVSTATNTDQARIYPNPSTGTVELKVPTNDSYTVTISDSFGKIVLFQTAIGSLKVNTSSFAKGVYFVKIISQERGFQSSKKLIVQ